MADTRKVIEAALFMSPTAVSFGELLGLSGNVLKLRKAVNELITKYNTDESALEVVETNSGFQMKVKPAIENKVTHFAASSEFSKSALKTLAFIAYKQPIKQSILIKYRSNKAYDDIKILDEKGFISKEPANRTYLLRTTKKFVKYFGDDAVKIVPWENNEQTK